MESARKRARAPAGKGLGKEGRHFVLSALRVGDKRKRGQHKCLGVQGHARV